MAAPIKRRLYLVDPKLQGALALRVVMYWLCCMTLATATLIAWRTLTGPARMFHTHLDDLWFHYGPIYVISLAMLPLFILDSIRMSNRFAGPVYRLRRAFRDLAAGKPVAPLHFRDTDFWQEVAAEFNAAMKEVSRRELDDAMGATKAPRRETSHAA